MSKIYHTIHWSGKVTSHSTVPPPPPVYIWWPLFPIYIVVQSKYTNNDSISNVQTSDYVPTMAMIMASYHFNSSRPIEVHTRTEEPDFRRLLKHIIIIIFRGAVGFSKSPRSYPLSVCIRTRHIVIYYLYCQFVYTRTRTAYFFFVHDTIIL